MKTLVIGANGGVGQHLVTELHAHNDVFTAGVRQQTQAEALDNKGIDTVLIDVEQDDIDTLTQKMEGYDTVVFSVGSGGKTGADKTIIVDLDGAVKTIEASVRANVKHYVMVSTYDSRREAFDHVPQLKPYTIAKHYADQHLRQSGLAYTIVHPGTLTDEPATDRIAVAKQFDDKGTITREDVARVLHRVVHEFSGGQNEFQVLNGTETLSERIANVMNK